MSLSSRSVYACVLFPALLVFSYVAGRAQTTGSLSGVVKDGTGSVVVGVPLTLSGEGSSPAASLHTTTDTLGAYHFDKLPFGRYQLSDDRSGDELAANAPITLSQETPTLLQDLTLKHRSANQPTAAPPSLQLQAAGIRGYIDPGGYSAPANAAAATDLVRGVADLNRAGDGERQSGENACSRQYALLQAVADRPDDTAAQQQLGEFYLSQQQPEKALPVLQRAWALNSHHSEVPVPLDEALLEDKQFQAAHDLLTANSTGQDSAGQDSATVHKLLARSDEGLGAFQQASLDYQAAADLQPTEANLYGVGYELILAGSPGAAAKVFASGLARYPESTMLLMGSGTAAFLQGHSAEATRTFLRAADLHPSDPRSYPFLSASSAISGVERDAVLASFRRYYELSPKSAEAAYFYALCLLHQGTPAKDAGSDQPRVLLKQAVELDPTFPKAHAELGSIYFEEGDFAHASEELATALRLDPHQVNLHYKLAAAYRHIGEREQAEEQMGLFLSSKDRKSSENVASDVYLKQFLSVFDRPSAQAQQDSCALHAH